MYTTIKVSDELRDRLKSQAAVHGRTIGEHLAVLADEDDRRARFARLRSQISASSEDQQASYREEAAAWDAGTADGLPAEDFSDWPGYASA